MQFLDVAVVGAGQAGLALGYYLKSSGLNFRLFDGAARVGDSWRKCYDSLRLFTPSEYDSLPGLRFPAPRGTYPTKDDVANYLEDYVDHFSLPVQLQTHITRLEQGGGMFRLKTDRNVFRAGRVVVATGPFQTPFVPAMSHLLDSDLAQLHSSAYHNRRQLPPGDVLVVGSGNSDLHIAEELLATHPVTLARGTPQPFLPQNVLGRSLFWWMEQLRLSRVPASSRLGRRLKQKDPVIGASLTELQRKGLSVTPRAKGAQGRTIAFADGQTIMPQSVIWATGFRPDFSWIHLPVIDAKGYPCHQQGVTSVEGLFLGLSWQRTRGSALLGWVGLDAAFIAEHVTRRSTASTRENTV